MRPARLFLLVAVGAALFTAGCESNPSPCYYMPNAQGCPGHTYSDFAVYYDISFGTNDGGDGGAIGDGGAPVDMATAPADMSAMVMMDMAVAPTPDLAMMQAADMAMMGATDGAMTD